MRKIAVITGNRSEYSLLKHIMNEIRNRDELELKLIVTGAHLSHKYGYTVNEIINDGYKIDEKVEIITNESTTTSEIGTAILKFENVFNKIKPDIILILGDRYEIFAVAATAMSMNIPIAHISGGEITEGAMDEQIRHSITKMAHIHFAGVKEYANNIRKMGEEDWRIFNVGEPGIENIKLTTLKTKEEISNELGIDFNNDTILVTYHPVTLEKDETENQINELIKALDKLNKNLIITYPNSDNGGKIIIDKLREFSKNKSNVYLYKNLGSVNFLSVMNLCDVIVGNSSSALIEAPYFKKPVVNIGNRQKGRLKANNIIDCSNNYIDILEAINIALSEEFRNYCKEVKSLYGEGNTSKEIADVLDKIELGEKILKKKLIW